MVLIIFSGACLPSVCHLWSTVSSYLFLWYLALASDYFLKVFCLARLSHFWFSGWREQASLGTFFFPCAYWYHYVLTFPAHTLGYLREEENAGNLPQSWCSELMSPVVQEGIWYPGFLVILNRKNREGYICSIFPEISWGVYIF